MGAAWEKITQLCAWGTSQAIRVPKEACRLLGVESGSELLMRITHDERGSIMILRPRETRHRSVANVPYASMDDLFKGYKGSYRTHEADWGDDVGHEVVE